MLKGGESRFSRFWLKADEGNSAKSVDTLTILALTYIALPNFCFLLGWLKLPYGIAGGLLLLISLWQFASRQVVWRIEYSRLARMLISVVACAWCIFGGAGHFTYANPDWIVRDAVYADLIYTPWPLAYGEADGAPLLMRSAIGYFLPPAALTHLLGIQTADWILYLWTTLGTGIFLLLLPLPQSAGIKLGIALLVVIFFSGMDFLGIVLRYGDLPIFPLRLEWWVPFSYTSLSGQLFWAPNHTLPIWISCALFYRHWANPDWPRLTVLLLPMLCIWTPFAAIGLLPFMALAGARWLKERNPLKITIAQWITAIALTVFLVRLMTIGVDHIPALPSKLNSPKHVHDTVQFLSDYALFVLMEFGILALVLWRQSPPAPGLFLISVFALLVLPLYQFGPSNDSLLRLSVTPLLILLITSMSVIAKWLDSRHAPPLGLMLISLLLIGAHTPFNEIVRAASFRRNAPDYLVTFTESQNGGKPGHYIGKLSQPDLIEVLRTPIQVAPRH